MSYPVKIVADADARHVAAAYTAHSAPVKTAEGKELSGWTIRGPGIIDPPPWFPGQEGETAARNVADAMNVAAAYVVPRDVHADNAAYAEATRAPGVPSTLARRKADPLDVGGGDDSRKWLDLHPDGYGGSDYDEQP